jgi:DNA polymerase III alpha subunit (gram-positive type)
MLTGSIRKISFNINAFDNKFFRAFFERQNDKYFGSWFWADSIDVYVLASFLLKSERAKLENFQQRTVAKYLGIVVDESKLHDATYDIGICIEIYNRFVEHVGRGLLIYLPPIGKQTSDDYDAHAESERSTFSAMEGGTDGG